MTKTANEVKKPGSIIAPPGYPSSHWLRQWFVTPNRLEVGPEVGKSGDYCDFGSVEQLGYTAGNIEKKCPAGLKFDCDNPLPNKISGRFYLDLAKLDTSRLPEPLKSEWMGKSLKKRTLKGFTGQLALA